MSIQSNFPSQKPSLLLDFANVGRLDPRVTFTRASSATYYDGVTTTKAEENLLLQSQTFNTTWGVTNGTVTANTDTAPDGTLTADTLSATSADARLVQSVTYGDGGDATFSVWIKRKTGTGTVSISHTPFGSVTSVSVDGTWQRFSVTTALSSGTRSPGIKLDTSGDEVYVWGAQLEIRSSMTAYTATTTQPITNYIPVLQTAAAGVARFDHNPTTGEALGLLIEEQRTNVLPYSEDFANADWTKSDATITSNTIIAPDGTLTGDKVITNNAAANGNVFEAETLTASTTYTFSCYAKAGEWSWVRLTTRGPENSDIGAWFNLSTGAVGTVESGVTASIQSVGNGWYRCIVTRTTGTGATPSRQRIFSTNADNTNSTGDGYSGIFIWGAQLEAGAFPTSYIKTTSASATRNADAASMTGTNFSSWFNNAEGTMYAQFQTSSPTSTSGIFSTNTAGNQIGLRLQSNNARFLVFESGTSQASIDRGSVTTNVFAKFSSAYKVNDFAASLNGAAVGTDTSGILPICSTAFIGQLSTAGFLNGTIKKIAYYPQRLSDAQLQALTG